MCDQLAHNTLSPCYPSTATNSLSFVCPDGFLGVTHVCDMDETVRKEGRIISCKLDHFASTPSASPIALGIYQPGGFVYNSMSVE